MQTKISTPQLELFNRSSLPEAVTLHADRPGFFSLLVKPVATSPRQSSYRVGLLPQVLAALDPDIDSYMSGAIKQRYQIRHRNRSELRGYQALRSRAGSRSGAPGSNIGIRSFR